MKKIILTLIMLLLLTGCTVIENLNYDELINNITLTSSKPNTQRTGFKYYLPRGMKVEESHLFIDTISSNNSLYYLYVDAISYKEHVNIPYVVNKNAYYSNNIINGDKYGYLEINLLENDKYLIEIMYNYAKIEVIVEKEDINITLFNAINILKSVEINEAIVTNLLDEDILNYAEEEFNIFNTKGNANNYITKDEDYVPEEQTTPDTDLIN